MIIVHCVSYIQESPTKEIADQPFPGVTEPGLSQSVQKEGNSPASPAGRTDTPSRSSEGSNSEESKGRTWVGKGKPAKAMGDRGEVSHDVSLRLCEQYF